jgi:hypothetical protein
VASSFLLGKQDGGVAHDDSSRLPQVRVEVEGIARENGEVIADRTAAGSGSDFSPCPPGKLAFFVTH